MSRNERGKEGKRGIGEEEYRGVQDRIQLRCLRPAKAYLSGGDLDGRKKRAR